MKSGIPGQPSYSPPFPTEMQNPEYHPLIPTATTSVPGPSHQEDLLVYKFCPAP